MLRQSPGWEREHIAVSNIKALAEQG